MPRPTSSRAALIISVMALFAALGGTSLAASGLIGTNQIKSNAVTTRKLADGAVTTNKLAHHAVVTSRLADGAVNSSKVANGSLTSADVAPNTFLAAGGTAANANRLGNRSAGDYLLGNGQMFVNRVQVPVGQSALIVSFGYGDLVGKCASGGVPQTEYVSHTSQVNLVDWVTDYGSPTGTTAIHTTNGLTNGGTYIESHSTVVPQAITWQAAYDNGTPHVTTAWTTGQDIGTTSCIFIGQAFSTN
jgi:hypothetical protein